MIAQDSKKGRRYLPRDSRIEKVEKEGDRTEMKKIEGASRFAILDTEGEDRLEGYEGRVERKPLQNISNLGGGHQEEGKGKARTEETRKETEQQARGKGKKERSIGSTKREGGKRRKKSDRSTRRNVRAGGS